MLCIYEAKVYEVLCKIVFLKFQYPLCDMIWEVLGPEIVVRIGHGTILCVISPLLGYIADIRHNSNYGAVYGLYTASYNLGLSMGEFRHMSTGFHLFS